MASSSTLGSGGAKSATSSPLYGGTGSSDHNPSNVLTPGMIGAPNSAFVRIGNDTNAMGSDPTNIASSIPAFNPNYIPADRIDGMVKDGLAIRHGDQYIYLADGDGKGKFTQYLLKKNEKSNSYSIVIFHEFENKGNKSHSDLIKALRTDEYAIRLTNVCIGLINSGMWNQIDQTNTLMLHLVPFGPSIDNYKKGNVGEGTISGLGDLSNFLIPISELKQVGKFARASKGLRRAGMAGSAGVGIARAGQGSVALYNGENVKAAGYFGEATLRLIGVTAGTIRGLKANRLTGSGGPLDVAQKATADAWRAIPQSEKYIIDQVLKGKLPRQVFNNLPSATKKAAIDRFAEVAAKPSGSLRDAASALNKARVDFLTGKINNAPGGIGGFK